MNTELSPAQAVLSSSRAGNICVTSPPAKGRAVGKKPTALNPLLLSFFFAFDCLFGGSRQVFDYFAIGGFEDGTTKEI